MSATALLAEAARAGAALRVDEAGKVRAGAATPPTLLDRLRAHKAELAALLTGRACRRCGARIVDRQPGWIPFADGTAAHLACEDRWEVERLQRYVFSPDALADEAELTIRGEPRP